MINIVVNGKETSVEAGTTVAGLIASYKLLEKAIIVELDGDVIPRGTYGAATLEAGNRVELVHFVGGG